MKKLLIAAMAMLLLSATSFASLLVYDANLSGPSSPGTGFTKVTIDTGAQTMEVQVSFSGLTSGTTASHIHCCIAPPGTVGVATTVPTFPSFPLGVTSGTYDMTFDLTSFATYNPAFVTANGGTPFGAEAALLAGIAAGDAYLNIHTTNFPGGEIRGFYALATPEPSSLAFLVAAIPGLLLTRRRRK